MNAGRLAQSATMDFWSPQYLDSTDLVNETIWVESPAEQALIQRAGLLTKDGDIGAQQIMVDGRVLPLPWVPDILGLEWKHSESVIIVGSAYAPFVAGISKRVYVLPLSEYVHAQSARDFLVSFLCSVVLPDRDYYDKIRLLAEDLADQKRIALFDLCRASYTVRGARCSRETMDEAAEYTFKGKLPRVGIRRRDTVPLAPKLRAVCSLRM
jgi:hypothetical protein